MATKETGPSLSEQKIQVIHAVQPWLNREMEHRRLTGFLNHRGNPADTRDHLLDEELPAEWNRFQSLRTEDKDFLPSSEQRLRVAQSVLIACATAQVAFIWDQVDRGREVDIAKGYSLVAIDIFEQDWKSKLDLPETELLSKPLISAVEEYDGKPGAYYKPVRVFRALLALSATAIVEQGVDADGPLLPVPGADRDALAPWQHE